MLYPQIIADVERYYSEKLRIHGPSPQGVDWNGRHSQEVRYDQLARLLNETVDQTITDVGCGYGGFLPFLRERGFFGHFIGTDVSADMINAAKTLCKGMDPMEFRVASGPILATDYITASGLFSVKLNHHDDSWTRYVLDTLADFNRYATTGFAFNCLTKYSDQAKMRHDLYYADPLFMFDYCKRHFSKNVSLLHDYDLYEFTILVRK